MEDQTPAWWRVDGHTFTALQWSVTDFHAVLAWLLHSPRSEERVDAFARLFPIVANLESLLAAIVTKKIPEAGEYLDAIGRASAAWRRPGNGACRKEYLSLHFQAQSLRSGAQLQ